MSQTAPVATAPDRSRWITLGIIAAAQLMVVLDVSIVNVSLPHMQASLEMDAAHVQWVVTAYTLAFGSLLLIGGRVADFWGRKRTFLVGLAGFATVSLIAGLAQTDLWLILARGAQGMFGAMLAPAALSIMTVTFTEPKERATAFGVFGAVSGSGAAIGLLLGGFLTDVLDWRWVLWVNVPIAIVVGLAAVLNMKESRRDGKAQWDIAGVVLAATGLFSLVFGFSRIGETEGTEGWTDPLALGSLALGVVLLVAFFVVEARVPAPMLPLRIVLDRVRGGSYLVFFFLGAGLFTVFLTLSFYLQTLLGYSALETGIHMVPNALMIILTSGLVSRLVPRFGPRPFIMVGFALAITAVLLYLRITPEDQYWTHVFPSLVLFGMGMACIFMPISQTALTGIEPRDAGVGSALLNTAQQVGGSIGLAILTTVQIQARQASVDEIGLSSAVGPAGNPLPFPESFIAGYHAGFIGVAVVMALGLITAFVLIRVTERELEEREDEAIGLH